MTNHYDNFQAAKQRVDSNAKSKRENRHGKKAERNAWWDSTAEMAPPASDKYREGWDRIFGVKPVQAQDPSSGD